MGSKQTSATPAGVARSRARLTRRERRLRWNFWCGPWSWRNVWTSYQWTASGLGVTEQKEQR
jgi:hypothetical protein